MPYILNTPEDQQEMLAAIGIASLDELFSSVPEDLRMKRELKIPPALTEMELTSELNRLARANESASEKVCFLGAGSYDHFIPAVVDYIASRGEYYTSYTPYQAEVSQGNLQAMFEYQTLITRLTGLDVSNASLYDGASALAEAVLMSIAATNRSAQIVVCSSVHPEYRQVLATYFAGLEIEIVTVETQDGVTTAEALARAVTNDTAAVVVQNPNFFGAIEDVEALIDVAHSAGALAVEVFDPISLGLFKRPGDCGADIAVAEGQSLGLPMSFGGPYLGIVACRESFVRKMPGRIAGQTVDRDGKRCWVLTLQTREQHIRREKATSNICTNQGLCALRAAVYLAALGPHGLREVAALCLQKANYLRKSLGKTDRLEPAFSGPAFKEFVVRDRSDDLPELLARASGAGYFAGVPLGRWYPELSDCLLISVTEKRSRQEMDGLVKCLSTAMCDQEAAHA